MASEVVKTGEVAKTLVLTREESVIVARALDVLRAQVERAIVKEIDPEIVAARRRQISQIRSIISKEIFA